MLTASNGEVSEIDVTDIGTLERKKVLQRLVGTAEEDNEKFLLKLRERIDIGIHIPTIEARFEHLNVEAEAHVGSRALSTYLNYLHILSSQKKQVTILKDTSGIVRPCPPSSGKTTLLLALAGKLGDLVWILSGGVTYNGHEMNEFVPQRTAIYISQNDVHIGEMTVRETLAFSARCQGVGSRFGQSNFTLMARPNIFKMLLQKFRLEWLSMFVYILSKGSQIESRPTLEQCYIGHVIAVPVRENHQAVLHRQAFPFAL
ncbi:hypothetical protein Ahy_A09g046478 [Arachis hypogaea]|uniref:Uncharacterized protein n=1 Tax=Arachis hypogaea TaxID=3818 RepID=A0A445BPX9_ARAHY|nr:hypothetical protein Ahy_A09g046478 [Arachis hypogaea]